MANPKFKIGDLVKTRFKGYETKHMIIDVLTDGSQGHCESGVLVRIEPDFDLTRDPGNHWIDQNWFELQEDLFNE